MKYIHLRNICRSTDSGSFYETDPRGGRTLGWFVEGSFLYVLSARCSKHDNYSRKTGRELIQKKLREIARGIAAITELKSADCAEIVEAYREELINTHVAHDYAFPDLSFKNIPFAFINNYVVRNLA